MATILQIIKSLTQHGLWGDGGSWHSESVGYDDSYIVPLT